MVVPRVLLPRGGARAQKRQAWKRLPSRIVMPCRVIGLKVDTGYKMAATPLAEKAGLTSA